MDGAQPTLRFQTVSDDAERSTSIASEFSLYPPTQAGLHPAPAAFSWGSSGAGIPMHYIARHHHHSSSCITRTTFSLPCRGYRTRNWPGLLSWTRAPRIFSRVTRARETTLCSNLMPVIPSRRSVCAEQASCANLGAERGVTPILISCSGMASCFNRARTSVCPRRHVTAKSCTHTSSTQWFADTRKKPHHYMQQLRWPGSPMQLQCKTIRTR
jgi:hypothetical protein